MVCIRSSLVLVVAVLALIGGACGDDGDEGVAAPTGADVFEGEVNDEGTEQLSGDSITIGTADFAFAPTFISDATGSVEVRIENTGSTAHTFTIDSLGVDEVVEPGEETQTTVELPGDGEPVVFVCRFHEDRGMKGAFGLTSSDAERSGVEDGDTGY